METNKEKSSLLNSVYTQIFTIIIAFIIMCVSSYLFVSKIERKHLVNDAENILKITETEVNSLFLEYETFLTGYSETIHNMLIWGIDENTLSRYKTAILNIYFKNTERTKDLTDVFGYFFLWGGVYLSGKEQDPPDDFNPYEHTWINSAISAKGQIVITENEEERRFGEKRNNTLKFSRCLMDDNDNPLAVICIEIDLERLFQNVIVTNLTNGSYGPSGTLFARTKIGKYKQRSGEAGS